MSSCSEPKQEIDPEVEEIKRNIDSLEREKAETDRQIDSIEQARSEL